MQQAEIHPPPNGTQEHRWWVRGAEDEAACEREGLSRDVLELRETLDALARMQPPERQDRAEIIKSLASIFLADRPRWQRIRVAWKLAFR